MSVSRVVFTYVDGRQIFTVPPGYDSNVRYHCWGGGGGAGGSSGGNSGGNGSAGGYTTGTFLAQVGDEIEVCVGGGGQQGATVNSGRKIASAEISGIDAKGRANTGCFGTVPDSTGDQYYPRYGDQLVIRRWETWTKFMNDYAVWPNNSFVGPSEENWDNQVWFPRDGDYYFSVAADNEARLYLDGELIRTTINNYNKAADTFKRRVTRGQHTLRIQGFNYLVGNRNPQGVACTIEASTNYLKFNPGNADFKPPELLNMIWNTRLGQSVDLTSQVPIWAAPLCTFYQPTSDYGWGEFSAGRNFAFVSATSTWTAEELARLNFSFNNIYTISRPVRITGIGDIDHYVTSGYYKFKRGETWELARYNWLGDPFDNVTIPFDKKVPNAWIPKQNMTYSADFRQRNKDFAAWDLPVPGADEIYVVGYVDGQARTLNQPRGSSNLRWTVNLTDGNDYGGGAAGRAAINVGTGQLNFYGGWGGQQGGQVIAGGGGGGGGASTINILNPAQETVPEPVVGLTSRWYQNLVVTGERGRSQTYQATAVASNPTCPGGPAYGWYTRSATAQTSATANVRELVILWDGEIIYQGLPETLTNPFVVDGYAYTAGTRRGSTLGWCINGDCGTCVPPDADYNNAFDIYRVAGNGVWYNDVKLTNGDLTITNQSKGVMPGTTKPATFRTAAVASEVSVATQPVFNLSGLVGGQPTSFTLEAWVYATGPGSGSNGGMVMNKDNEYEFARRPDGRIIIAVDWGQGAADSLPGSGWMYTDYFLPLNEAHLLSVVFEGTDCRLYVDGNLEWSAAIDGFLSNGTSGTRRYVVYRNTPRSTNRRFYVGTRTSKNQNWDGWITDVRLWNVARTQTDIQASLNDIAQPVRRVRSANNITAAAGGGGGGGAGSGGNGQDASASYKAFNIVNPNSKTAGDVGGFTPVGGTGGGGGGGGGADGGSGGSGGSVGGEASGRGGAGGTAGKGGIMVNLGGIPQATYALVGRGGFGGASGGGGGGGGDVISGTVQLRKTQRIEIGGAGDRGGEWDGTSVIRFTETEYIAAGPGGKGGENGAPWGTKGEGQPGGCPEDSRTPVWGGSGGGGGVELRRASAAGGKGNKWSSGDKAPGKPSVSQGGNGGNTGGSPSYSSGGGGGAGGSGQNGESSGKAGNGGAGKEVRVGGKLYTLGAGGGGSAGRNRRGIQYAGIGGRGGGGDGESGEGSGLEYTVPADYSFTVPRGVNTIFFEAIGGGGGGGTGAPRGNGGGGSGGFLPRTPVTVYPGARVAITVGRPGKSGENGGSTTIRVFNASGQTADNIVLSGGRAGTSSPSDTPRGGAGGAPNGNAGEDGGKPVDEYYYSGRGADSPLGSGGKDASTKTKDDKESKTPGNADGYGAGGGGGYSGRAGGLGSGGYVRIEWNGVDSKSGLPNTGSGGGGGFEDFGGNGGTGFCVIAYPGTPKFQYLVNNRPVEPLQENGYTIHECRTAGDLVYIDGSDTGQVLEGNGTVPPAQNVTGYIPGSGTGGFGRDPSVFPVQSSLYPQFLNNHGVWERDPNAANFDRDFQVFFPVSTEYVLTCYADNGAQVSIDGGIVLDLTPATRDNGSYWWKNGAQTQRSIASGQRTVSWRATNLGTAGAFALTIAPANNPSQLIFDSRRPPVTGGSGNGNPGLVILEFPVVEGASQVKINDANGVPVWRKITGTWVKVGGVWKVVQASWVKLDGAWRSLFGALGITSAISTTNFGGPPRPDSKIDVTCIAVVDETNRSQSDAAFDQDWATFRSNYPKRPFWILIPPYPNLSVYVPEGYNESNLGFGPVDVNRDRGVVADASDWFTITGCDRLAPGSKVALSIDVSGSLTRANVQASINLFVAKCQAAGLNLVLNSDFPRENYIAPFNRNF